MEGTQTYSNLKKENKNVFLKIVGVNKSKIYVENVTFININHCYDIYYIDNH